MFSNTINLCLYPNFGNRISSKIALKIPSISSIYKLKLEGKILDKFFMKLIAIIFHDNYYLYFIIIFSWYTNRFLPLIKQFSLIRNKINRLFKQCEMRDISQLYRPSRPASEAHLLFSSFAFHSLRVICLLLFLWHCVLCFVAWCVILCDIYMCLLCPNVVHRHRVTPHLQFI
jgi:hypothetical protein